MCFEWHENKRLLNVRDHGVDFIDMVQIFDGRPTFTYHSPRRNEDRWGTVGIVNGKFYLVCGRSEETGGGSSPHIEPMTGKSENIVSYTAEEIEAKRTRGEGRTNWAMSQEEAMRRRRADPEAPQPYQGWQDTVTLQPSPSKEQVTLRVDRDVLAWFRTKGRGYQTRINAVLRAYYLHERGRGS